ncbi:hypothetical protein CLAFUW4_01898 [Fulvia fulva]|uniref:Zn(2)-C6 fungal-type domain-containing protein n=1 Tax=Passalora fulva TaxID=5499 RepID=A0A9Q8L8Y4_PASFU|nr:uncharacterized protein CLAFUR5_01892 [Fulvia fulva]KAK4635158.1 hypothetical protein CLAFUR4_01893 [Fulvia fulva]KAK4637328.1 hypothetical protein CLAFUR0_01895 [Fulvia fulva]UJO12970.1 hypothetical protein CLAFUR5_01892 [Fulvia fulva]WPV09289.1 hypothetical protein CLAFUW4_01898 [Fulvia fulva]WPV23948.1 hypothetical protein CLAFUW7_01897 [Fulvia fulva]
MTDRESYPSPGPASNGLPFYQQQQQQQQHTEQQAQEHERQHGSAESRAGVAAPTQTDYNAQTPSQSNPQPPANAHHEVPDDPHLRASIINRIGSFGTLGAPPPNMTRQSPPATPSSAIPQGSVAYAQYNGSADAAPPAADKNKDKRTKVSRACDECRRKKIRCDALDETANMPCTNCARTGAKCAFSRQPMKRGPSKGYIKELAERLNSLEQQVQPPHLQQQHRYEIQQVQQAMAEQAQQTGISPYHHDPRLLDPRVGDKRTHEMAEALHNGQVPLQAQQLPPNPYHQASGSNQPFWRHNPNENRQDPVGFAYEAETTTAITSFDWDEAVIEEYYRIIHQTFPLLPNSRHRLRQRLGECPASLREAFLAALDCLMRTFPTTALPPNDKYPQALKRTAELLAQYPFDNPSSHTNATNLVYLQTLILMALESDNHGPATIRGQAGPSRAEWLGRAAGVAGQLEINVIRTGSTSVMEGDRDSEERLARRVWWVLFILDRWHASSTADLLKLPENSVVLLPEDQILLGESTYHLARLSFIIGHLAAILTTTKTPSTDVMAPSNPASSLLGLTLAGEIDRFRESVESVWGSLNLVHLSYHHCHLLIKRLNPTTEPSELVGHAVKVATVLNSRLTPVTPLNHHFGALAAMTLCELCDVPKTRAEAAKGLEQMAECLGEGRGLAGRLESEGWDGAVRELVKKKREKLQERESLQSLAETAVGDNANFDPTMLTRYGYLTSLGQGLFGRDGL